MKAAWVFLPVALIVGAAQAARVQDARPLMGTVVEVVAEGADEMALRGAIVSAINDAAGARPVAIPGELMEVLAMARRISQRSRGAFDVTIAGVRGWRFRQDDPDRKSTRLNSSHQLIS